MTPSPKAWRRYEELRPDELAAVVETSPVAYWPLGLLEHHGWHLPVGFDGLKAERICIRAAGRTGGVVLPVIWWGGGGGHDAFHWTLYQEPEAYGSILTQTLRQIVDFGFRAVVLLAGHYPWQGTLDRVLPPLQAEHPEVLFLWGTEVSIADGAAGIGGDHAARTETSFGLALLPELVHLGALRPGRGEEAWPRRKAPAVEGRHPGVQFDPGDPLFAQMGEDARKATAEQGEAAVGRVVDALVSEIVRHLEPTSEAGEGDG